MRSTTLPKPLSRSVATPLYHQLKEILREKIESGEWQPGDAVPSENQLYHEYGVSRATIRQALSQLALEGLIYREQGRGTFVAPPKLNQQLVHLYSFTEDMRAQGLRPRSQVLDLKVVAAGRREAGHLQVEPGTPVLQLVRLRIANEEPLMLETTFVPDARFPGLADQDFERRPLYELLQHEYGVRFGEAVESFESVVVTEAEAYWLDVKAGSPALLLERVTTDLAGVPVEYGRCVVRGDRCKYSVRLRPHPGSPAGPGEQGGHPR